MKRPISFRLDDKLWVFVKDKPNRSKYIEELIKQDIQQGQVKPIVQSVISELLVNEPFFREMKERLGSTPGTGNYPPPVSESTPKMPLSNLETDYPCCVDETKRCRHWIWDGLQSAYINEITKKRLEVTL